MKNRRKYSRILFSTPATLVMNEHTYNCELLDISLNGALVSLPDKLLADKNALAELTFSLPESQVTINISVEIRHIEQFHLGLHCVHIDIDSITHLKRLVELNLGDDDLLHRELTMLIHTPE